MTRSGAFDNLNSSDLRPWLDQVRAANRRQLLNPPVRQLAQQRGHSLLRRTKALVKSFIPGRIDAYAYTWTMALNAHGAVLAHQATGDAAELDALRTALDRQTDSQGKWTVPIDQPPHTMKGYAILLSAELREQNRYRAAAQSLVDFLVTQCPRGKDGCIPYTTRADEVLVDTLAMICPLLALHGRLFDDKSASDLARHQMLQFVRHSVDEKTALPYHGYFPDTPGWLGLLGWGRGVGWYLMGLVDLLEHVDRSEACFTPLHEAFVKTLRTCIAHQRPDGQWHWVILHREDLYDSSTTSLLAYAMARGLSLGLLEREMCEASLKSAVNALRTSTAQDGLVQHGLAECRGVGKYPQVYSPQPWLQGSTTALAAWLSGHSQISPAQAPARSIR